MAGKILKFLPKSASFSIPNSSNNNKTKHKYAFSGPLLPMIPDHCRRKRFGMLEEEEEEPTSPKVSCIGQVNHHNNKKKSDSSKNKNKNKNKKTLVSKEPEEQHKKKKKEAPKRSTSLMFWRKAAKPAAARRDVDDGSSDDEAVGAPAAAAAAGIGRMRRFASGRVEALKDFDWRTMVDDQNNVDHDEQLVPHSAPMLIGGGGAVGSEPKKEMNIWTRRTRTPPVPPLHVN